MNTALLRGEQALLGAVLLDPGQLEHLQWLGTGHFYRPAHAAVWSALRTLAAREHPALAAARDGSAVPMSWLTDTLAEASPLAGGLTASYLHTLVSHCPRPEHAPLYGRIVLEAAIHRRVTEHATRLHQASRSSTGPDPVADTLHYARVLADVLNDLAQKTGVPRSAVLSPTQPLASSPPQPSKPQPAQEQLEVEQALLGRLIDQPGELALVSDRLRAGDFTEPRHGHLFRCLSALAHRGEPIDPVIVLWEAQHRGLLADNTLDIDYVLKLPEVGLPHPEYLGEQVLAAALQRTAGNVADAIRSLAADTTLPANRLISQALDALTPLREIVARWRTPDTTRPAARPASEARLRGPAGTGVPPVPLTSPCRAGPAAYAPPPPETGLERHRR